MARNKTQKRKEFGSVLLLLALFADMAATAEAKTPLDKYSVHVGEAAIHNKKRNNHLQERFNGTSRAAEAQTRHQERRFTAHYRILRPLQLRPAAHGHRETHPGPGGRHHHPRVRQVADDNRQRRLGSGGGTVKHLGGIIRVGPLRVPAGLAAPRRPRMEAGSCVATNNYSWDHK